MSGGRTPDDDDSAASGTSPGLDEELHRAARLAGDAVSNASEAAGVAARTVGRTWWKAVTSPLSALDTARTVAKMVTGTGVTGTVGEGVRQVRHAAWNVLGVEEPLARSQRLGSAEALRQRGDSILGLSHIAKFQPYDIHPSFAGILDELTADEARILRFLAVSGPQPMIDVRTKTLFQLGSELLASGINMVAELAGCRWPALDKHYFANLNRLGLVRLSSEPIADYRRYALIEVQIPAMEALAKAKKSITVYRSIHLTEFGSQFVEMCLDTTGYDGGGWGRGERGDKIIGKRARGSAEHTGT
jgi:hypothetical protein